MNPDITRIFSDYREEWVIEDFSERFVQPPYYAEFVGRQPVFLVGGRGTGKTIALRSLHFRNSSEQTTRTGIYVKAFKNRVQAFSAHILDDHVRIRAFEHYINLLCCLDLTEMCLMFWPTAPNQRNHDRSLEVVRDHFRLADSVRDYDALRHALRRAIARLSRYVNDPRRNERPHFSSGEVPVVDMCRDVHEMLDVDTPIYICIDEWENLTAEQQQALNGWIKNCEAPITYKLGVREEGRKTSRTGDGTDRLSSPADFLEKRIADASMRDFCRTVVEKRLARAQRKYTFLPRKLGSFLESVDRHAEAELLGARRVVEDVVRSERDAGRARVADWLEGTRLGDAYLAVYEKERRGEATVAPVVRDAWSRPAKWKNTINNYGHASLFAITRGRLGARTQKIYAGSATFLSLSGGNVRYLLELMNETVVHFDESALQPEDLAKFPISVEIQTAAARAVAKRRLEQMEGLSDHGLMIVRLVRSLGTAFGATVRHPTKRAPEQTSFTIVSKDPGRLQAVRRLVKEGCAVSAFLVETTNKRTKVTEEQGEEFRIHPILAPHFLIPYRRKRRVVLDADVLDAAARGRQGAEALFGEITGEDKAGGQLVLL